MSGGGGGGGGGVTGNKASKWMTAVCICVSTLVNVTPLDIFKETLGQFPVVDVF